MTNNDSLFSSVNRVEAPFVYVTIGGYSFGVYNKSAKSYSERYPNFIQSLEVKRINGLINQYTLHIKYQITENDDPNFFEYLFSSISDTRKIRISYGDSTQPGYVQGGEDAIITSVKSSYEIENAAISYTVAAVSASQLSLSKSQNRSAYKGNPINKIRSVFYSSDSLKTLFTGVKEFSECIPSDVEFQDIAIPAFTNISDLDYVAKLAEYIVPANVNKSDVIQPIYAFTVVETSKGPSFKITKVAQTESEAKQYASSYITVGERDSHIVTSIQVNNDCNWAILYNTNKKKAPSTTKIIDDSGNLVDVYDSDLASKNIRLTQSDKNWWSQVTQYPVQVTITMKGLLKPAILMTYINLNVYFYGKKSIISGVYIITAHTDNVDGNGYFSTLTMTRIGGTA